MLTNKNRLLLASILAALPLVWVGNASATPWVTLSCAGAINYMPCDPPNLVSGATVSQVSPEVAEGAQFHYSELTEGTRFGSVVDGVFGGHEALRHTAGTYSSGRFGLYTEHRNSGAFVATPEGVGAYGALYLDDVVFTGSDPTTTVSLNLDISGLVTQQVTFSGFLSIANIGMGARIHNSNFGGSFNRTMYRDIPAATTISGLGNQINDGIWTSIINDTITTGPVVVPTNVPVIVSFDFVLLNIGGGAGYTEAIMDFSNTFGLPTVGPIFNLESGVTVSNASGLIVNNQNAGFLNVPAPPALGLVLMGLAALCRPRRRRRQG